MEMKPVTSSNVQECGYDPETQTSRLRFKNGGLYDCKGVTQEQHDALVAAESIGKHFHANFRGNEDYTITKVVEQRDEK